MILTAKHRAVKINLCDDLFCTGKVHRCCNADLGLQHAADHALHAINLRSGSNFQRIGDAAAFHEFDVYKIRSAHLHDFERVFRREHAFIRKHRHIGTLGNVFQALKIMSCHRLLHKLNVKPFLLHLI